MSLAFASIGRRNRVARRVLVALAAVAVLGNLAFFLVADALADKPLLSAADGRSESLVLIVPVGDGQVLTATRDDELILQAGGEPAARTQFDSLIGALAVLPDGSGGNLFAVGLSDGRVEVLDGSLQPVRELHVEGRVVGLAATSAGDLLVGHGVGAYGDRYFVSAFPGTATEPAFSIQVNFTIGALTALGDRAVFGTLDSRVGVIAGGAISWSTTLRSPITRLLALGEPDRVLVGSENGDLTLLEDDGTTRWTTNIGAYPVRGLAYDAATGTYVAGDAHGSVVALDATGYILLSRTVANIDVEAIWPDGAGDLLIAPRDGAWQTLHPGAIDSARQLGRVRLAWLLGDALLLVAAAAATILAVEPWAVATERQLRAIWQSRLAYCYLLPMLGLVVLFSYYPAGMAFYYSFTNFSVRAATEFVGLENYRQVLFHDAYFRTGLENMVIIVVTSVLKTITMPLLVAQLIFSLRNSVHQYLFRTLFVLPAVVPDLIFTLMWRQVYDPSTGLLNQLLMATGLGQYQRAWLGDEQTAIWAIVGVGFPFVSAFAFLIFLGGLLNINPEYFDAAKVDGARWWQRLIHLDLPLLLPQFRILLFFAVVGAIQGLANVFILTHGGPGTATYVPALQMYLRIAAGDFGYASAVGVVLFVLILVLTLVILRFRRNEAIEGM